GITEENIGAYQDAIRSGKLTADQLHAHIYDSAWLSEQIGAPVDTGLDILLTTDFDEGEEEGDDEEEHEDIDPVNYYDDDVGEEYPLEEPHTKTIRLGPDLFTITRNP